jgi:ADP-heptose:LPS heptosyltransferase
MSAKLKIYYHVSALPGWPDIMSDQLSKLSEHGLLEMAQEINICTVGDSGQFADAKQATKDFSNIHWHHVSERVDLMEYATLNFIHEAVQNSSEEFYVLYMHQKGITRPKDLSTADWRQYLDYWSIEQWKTSIDKLDEGYDIVGTNWIEGYEAHTDAQGNPVAVWPHFSGGTWWAHSKYLKKLEPLLHPDNVPYDTISKLTKLKYTKENWRYDHEAWHGSGQPKQHTLDRTPGSTKYAGWHFHNRYPRENYAAPLQLKSGTSYTPAPYHDLKMSRILIDRRKALGDVLMITPVLKELRRRYGMPSYIQVVTEEPHALHNNPHVNAVVRPAEMKKEDPWDVYINLNDAYETSPLVNYVDAYLRKAFGRMDSCVAGIDRSIEIFPTTREIENVKKIVEEQINSRYVVIHMRRWAWENKNIDLNTWGSFMTLLNHHYPDVKVVSVGAQYDYGVNELQNGVNLVDKLSIGEIATLVKHAACFVGGDSGPYHIASSTPVPIVALLSHLNPEQILPWRDGEFGKNVTVVQSKVPCVGCYARQTDIPVRNLKCENPVQWACAQNFSFREIYAAVEQHLK